MARIPEAEVERLKREISVAGGPGPERSEHNH